jgi:U4/U6 small nuclear ribonucleoprotein PRP3
LQEAVKDPTAVEARVNKEIAERKRQHNQANEDRKLTKEQRHEKLAANQDKDAAKGIHIRVFRINTLANGQHRFKISKNAEQMALTGVCILHPKTNIVIVEGGEHSIRQYQKLMLNRIDWTENAPSRDKEGRQGAVREWLRAESDTGDLKDISLNECNLLFSGEEKARSFRKFTTRVCETTGEAREMLARYGMENFFSLAQ